MKSLNLWTWLIIIVLFVSGWGLAAYFYKKSQNQDTENSQNAAITKTATKLVKNTLDSFKKAHNISEAQSPITAKQRDTQKLPGWADTAARGLDLGANYKSQINEQTNITLHLKDSLVKASQMITAAKREAYYYQNKYLKLQYTTGNPVDTTDKGSFSYNYNADITVTQFARRNWFLGALHQYIDVSAADTNMRVNGVQHYQVAQASPTFGLRIQAISTYNLFSKRVQGGLGAAFNAGRFTFLGAYTYELYSPTPAARPYTFLFSTKYDIFRF